MYNVRLSNGGGKKAIEIKVTNVPWNTAWWIVGVGNGAFRDTEIVDNETGEVAYNRYASDTVFEADCTVAEVLDLINKLVED